MKRFTIVAVLLGFIVVSLIARPALTDQTSEKTASLEELQKERIDALKKVEDILAAQFKIGTATFDDLCKAQNEIIEAKLEATDKPDERIALLEKQLKIAQENMTFIDRQSKVGLNTNLTQTDFFRAKAHCLAIEIKLLKERDTGKITVTTPTTNSLIPPPSATTPAPYSQPYEQPSKKQPNFVFQSIARTGSQVVAFRAKVPTGWFVVTAYDGNSSSFFYPDPEHKWDGED